MGLTKKNTEAENVVVYEMKKEGFDGMVFTKNLRFSFERLLEMRKAPKQIRYHHYFRWAIKLRNNGIGKFEDDQLPAYAFPVNVLKYMKSMLPSRFDEKEETFKHAHPVTIKEFCEVLAIPPLKDKEKE